MIQLRSHKNFLFLKQFRSFHGVSHYNLKQRVKLLEVPDLCTSEEWNAIIQDARETLQTHFSKNLNIKNEANRTSIQTMVKRLQQTSYNSSHLIDTFKQLLENSDETASGLRWPGLITLMLSKGVGNPFQADDFVTKALEDVIWSSQIVLAEIINILHCGHLFRKENSRVSSSSKKTSHTKASNEIDRLVSSYFTSLSIYKLSELKNFKVVSLIGNILDSMSKTRVDHNFPIIRNIKAWEYETFHPQGILLANGCQAALELAGHDEKTQQTAFEFGKIFSMTLKANADIQQYWNYQMTQNSLVNISGFPIVLHLQSNPETLAYLYSCGRDLDNIDSDQLNSVIISSSGMEEARQQLANYVQETMDILHKFEKFENSEIIDYLMKLVKAMNNINEK